MSDLSKKLELFFESECKTLTELDTVIKESVAQQEWLDAVALYRKGTLALQKNDLGGIEIIKAANEALKKIVAGKTKVESVAKNLTESFDAVNKDNITESIVKMKLAFTPFYVAMKENGYKELINEETFYDDGEKILKEQELEIEPEVTSSSSDDAKPTVETLVEPAVTQVEDQKEEPKKSAYQEGFDAGRKYWSKDSKSHNESLKTVIEQNLYESPYNYVTRYSEGFKAGFSHERMVQEDLCPECFKNEETPSVEPTN